MAALSDETIERLGIIRPFEPLKQVHHMGASWGLSHAGYDIRIKQNAYMFPGRFKLASTVEYFDMPNNVIGRVCDKSTLIRLGISLHNTEIEPGWRGYLTLEIKNESQWRYVKLFAGQPIAQVVFHFTDKPVRRPYRGKYQDQPDRPVHAIREK